MFPLKCVYTGNRSATQTYRYTSFRNPIRHFDDNDVRWQYARHTFTGNKNRNIVFGSTMHGFLFAKSIQWRMCFVIIRFVVAGSSRCLRCCCCCCARKVFRSKQTLHILWAY